MTVFPVPESEPLPWGLKIYNFGKGFKNLSSFYSLSAKVEKILTLYHSYMHYSYMAILAAPYCKNPYPRGT